MDESKLSSIEKEVLQAIKKVEDPEIGLPIYDMGLIYGVKVDGEKAKITMTLTTEHCPLSQMIVDDVGKAVGKVKGIKEAKVKITFDPPWSPEMMPEETRKKLFG